MKWASRASVALVGVVMLASCGRSADMPRKALNLEDPNLRPMLAPPAKAIRLAMVWREALVDHGPIAADAVEFSQPALHADGRSVIVGTSRGKVAMLDRTSGALVWSHQLDGRINGSPGSWGDAIYVGTTKGELIALDPLADTPELWRTALGGPVDGNVVVTEDWIYVVTANEVLHAVDRREGQEIWSHGRREPDYFTLTGVGQPLVLGTRVIVGYADGVLVALDGERGRVAWIANLGNGETQFTDIDGPLLHNEGLLYAASYAGGLYALDAATGEQVWFQEMTGASGAVLVGDDLYTTTANRVVAAFDPRTGAPRWRARHKHAIPTHPVGVSDYLVYGSTENGLYVMDRNHGRPMLHLDTNKGVNAPITLDGTRTFVMSNGGVLYAFDLVRR